MFRAICFAGQVALSVGLGLYFFGYYDLPFEAQLGWWKWALSLLGF